DRAVVAGVRHHEALRAVRVVRPPDEARAHRVGVLGRGAEALDLADRLRARAHAQVVRGRIGRLHVRRERERSCREAERLRIATYDRRADVIAVRVGRRELIGGAGIELRGAT
ncbi:MAG: hypothetical protein ACK56I_10750, partial [bacterium]